MGSKKQDTAKESSESRSHQSESLDQQQNEHPASIIRRAYATPGALTQRDVLRLQRTIGNRAVIQLLRKQSAPEQTPTRVTPSGEQIQRTLARGSGWGVFSWSGGAEGKALWERLEKRFNTDFPRNIQALTELTETHPFWVTQINEVKKLIQELLDKHTTVTYTEASTLDETSSSVAQKYATVIENLEADPDGSKRATTQREVNELINRLKALNSLKIKDQVEEPDRKGKSDMEKDLQKILKENRYFAEGEKDRLSKSVTGVEKSFQSAAKKSQEAEDRRRQEEQQRELERQKQEAENLRQQQLSEKIKKVVGSQFVSLRNKCGDDLDLLDKLVSKISRSDVGKLNNALSMVSKGAELLDLFEIHSSTIEQLNNLLTALFCPNRGKTLKALLQNISASQEGKLATAIAAAGGDANDHLKELIVKADIDTLNTLLAQGDTATLKDLLVTKALNVGQIKTLLTSTSKADTVSLLVDLPDPALLNKIQPLATSPAQLRSLVKDIGRVPAAVTATRRLLNRTGTPATLGDILADNEVMQARGLKTNANVTIGETKVASLNGTGEQAAVQATLTGISTGKYPTLSHPNNAKFGDTFNNDQGRLPGLAGADGYTEYYVEKDPASESYHGERRLVVSDTTGHIYYTDDHYASFKRIQ